jgi:hypothetical protein
VDRTAGGVTRLTQKKTDDTMRTTGLIMVSQHREKIALSKKIVEALHVQFSDVEVLAIMPTGSLP